jgi:hypothetical protein
MTGPEYVEKLLKEIELAKAKGRRGVFKMREKLSTQTATYARDYLTAHTQYRIEFRKCPACAFEWDIVIIF